MTHDNWNSRLYDQKHSFVYEYGKDLLSLLQVQPGEKVLDVGCGTGHLTAQIAAAGAQVTGLDFSAAMIEKARIAYPALEFLQADATSFSFPFLFDAIFSNATLHWISDPEAAIRCMTKVLRPGGKFVVEFGGKNNIAHIMQALSASLTELGIDGMSRAMYFPSIGEYSPLLEKHGLEVTQAFLFERPTPLDGEDGMLNWLRMFATIKTEQLSDTIREQVFALAVEKLRSTQYVQGQWFADYRRIRFVAQKTLCN